MSNFLDLFKKRAVVAVVMISSSVLLCSFHPLAFKLANGETKTLMFAIFFKLAGITAGLSWLLIEHRNWFKGDVLRLVFKNLISPKALPACLSWLGVPFLILAAGLVEVAIVSIISQLNRIIFIFFMSPKTADSQRKYGQTTTARYLLFIMAFGGVSLVVLSQFGWQGFGGQNPVQYSLGLGLAISAAFLIGMGAYTFKLARQIQTQANKKALFGQQKSTKHFEDNQNLFLTLIISLVMEFIVFIVLVGAYFVFEGNLITDIGRVPVNELAIIIFSAYFIYWSGRFLWQKAILRTDNLDINMIGYIGPILAILWLSIFGLANVESLTLLWVGTILVVTANALIGWLDLKRTPADKPHRHHLFHHHQP